MKVVLAAPAGWTTDVLRDMVGELAPSADIEIIADMKNVTVGRNVPELILFDVDAAASAAAGIIAGTLRLHPACRIVAMGSNLEKRAAESLLSAGALAYMPRNFSREIVKATLQLVLGIQPAGPAGSVLPDAEPGSGVDGTDGPAVDFGLTRRQADVLALICEGKSNHAIGQQLGISEGTVKQHLTPIFGKLKVRNRSEALLLASRSSSVSFRQVKKAEGGKLDLDWLLGHMAHERLARNTVLFRMGDAADELYYLQRGNIRLHEIDTDLGEGTLFGEIGIFAPNHKRTCSAVCTTQVDVFKLTAGQVKRLYLLNPQFGLYIVHMIAKRLMADRSRRI